MIKISSLLFALFWVSVCFAQTSNSVRSIFQEKCVSCHNSNLSQGGLNLDGSTEELISRLLNISPSNSVAAQRGHKLLAGGYPERSYLLRLINSNGWENYYQYNLKVGENPGNHQNLVNMEKHELELIRQWVLFNCPNTGNVISEQTLYNYYNANGLPKITPPAPPDSSQGFQIKLGPVFLTPGEEVEYYKKHALEIPEAIEVKKIDCKINDYSHHYLLFKFQPGTESDFEDGLRRVTLNSVFPEETEYLVTFTRTDSFNLPQNTAYRWGANTVLDLNYHLINYNNDSIFAAESFVNIYTQPFGTAPLEMFSRIVVPQNNPLAQSLFLPYSPDTVTFQEEDYTSFVDTINIWMLTSHTHARGVDFDIFKRKANGQKGDKIYEGFYNETYQFNQNYYSWSHPPIRYFDPMLPIKSQEGVIFEGRYCNFGPDAIIPFTRFGLTKNDEMFIYFVQYTRGGYLWNTTGADELNSIENRINIYPNPATNLLTVEGITSTDGIEIFNLNGQKLSSVAPSKLNRQVVEIDIEKLPAGVYILSVSGRKFKFTKI